MTNTYFIGLNQNEWLGPQFYIDARTPVSFKPYKELEGKRIQDISSTLNTAIYLTTRGEIYETNPSETKLKHHSLKNVKEISDFGKRHCLALTKNNKVYLWGYSNEETENMGLTELLEDPQEISFFEELQPIHVYSSDYTCWVLCKNGDLYGWGSNKNCRMGKEELHLKPHLFKSEVKEFYCDNFFLEDFEGKWYCWGENKNHELSLEMQNTVTNLTENSLLSTFDINQFLLGETFSIILTKSNELYFSGKVGNIEKRKFTKDAFALDSTPRLIACSPSAFQVITEKNSLYNFGNQQLVKSINSGKINFAFNKPIYKICSGFRPSLFIFSIDHFIKEMQTFYESQLYGDIVIQGFKLHKIFLEKRVGLKSEIIEKKLEKIPKEKLETFFNWVYSGIIGTETEYICQLLGVPECMSVSIDETLNNLFLEDSKDFSIMVKDEELEENEEIPVHKFILCAKSGLFREMFQNINEKEETNSVQDYSGKSIESIEILIKFLYTNLIELTADHDVDFLIEELEDAEEYYQLNEKNNFFKKLKKYKN
ncbi:hypothetical protein M0812_04376 [Anaeramoeba flamelloides]|uniref:BTB domain-containing protein n=1 Tax=Anaeramoeba flamelloides TaxID=1746091 RepID=A0AAV8AE90_9EUKA|nr:hypothetical protein M0812_04376 [Anaeramoeba flamelloides]